MITNGNSYYRLDTLLAENWLGDGYYIIDETTPEGRQMAKTYIKNYPFVDFEHDGEYITNVIVLEKPEKPPEVEGKEIQLVKNEQGKWKYIYVDVPLTPEQELELKLAQNTVETLELISALNEIQKIEQAQSNAELIELMLSVGGM